LQEKRLTEQGKVCVTTLHVWITFYLCLFHDLKYVCMSDNAAVKACSITH